MTTAAEEFLAHRPVRYGPVYRLLGSAHDAQVGVRPDAHLRGSAVDHGAGLS
ncbi:hypothetical protein ACNTMW_23190 [Planosporangium sp. 12N6]|uniref:hypothetical protein n=1 Tax=Planosporangium spinosum TaxID=3402278 RepID=UPI003CEEDA73